MGETCAKVCKGREYLHRAADPAGDTIEFMPDARRDASAAQRFFKKLTKAGHRRLPSATGTDKHAACPEALAASVSERVLLSGRKLRRVEYLNSVTEQDHRAIRRRWRAMRCFRPFHTAGRTPEGVESMHMIRKGHVKRLDSRDATGQAKFVESLSGVAA